LTVIPTDSPLTGDFLLYRKLIAFAWVLPVAAPIVQVKFYLRRLLASAANLAFVDLCDLFDFVEIGCMATEDELIGIT